MLPSSKPYLIRAIYEWCNDNGFTPYLAVAVDAETKVPRGYVKDGEIVLNIGGEATQGLMMGNDEIRFQARFGGVAQTIVVPVTRVLAVYARENGQGMAFEVADASAEVAAESARPEPPGKEEEGQEGRPGPQTGRPHLTRIK